MAKQRQRQATVETNSQLGHKTTLVANLAEASLKGEAHVLAAEMLGMKRGSAEKALLVVQAIDLAVTRGRQVDADLIITHLNKSVMSGYKSTRALGYLTENHEQTSGIR